MNILKILNKKIYIVFVFLFTFMLFGCDKVIATEKEIDADTEEIIEEEINITNNIEEENVESPVEEESYEWEKYKILLSDEEYAAFQRFIPLFENNMEFYCFPIEQKCNFRNIKEQFEVDNYSLVSFTVIDMDNNGEEELVIKTSMGPGMTFVISEIDNEFYGSYYSSRELNNLQKNGNFIGSGAADSSYFSHIDISKNGFETVVFAERKGWGEDANWTEDYYNQFMKDNYSNAVDWYELNIYIE